MNEPIRLAINGARGRMGRLIIDLAATDARFDLAARCDGSTDWSKLPPVDVVVDFSSPAGLAQALGHCTAHGIALASGTTGFDDALRRQLGAAAARIAVLHAANFSLGVAWLARLLRQAAAALPDWDLDIVEAHHRGKRDAPSGTALALGRAAAEARGVDFDHVACLDRNGLREPGAIGFASLRAGDIVGEHAALLATTGERLELGHRATDRAIFARGALQAAAWLVGRAPGLYALDEVLGGEAAQSADKSK